MQSSFLRSAATGILIGAVLVTLVWVVARVTGEDFRIQAPGADTPEKLPIFFPPIVTILLGAIATGVALLFRRRGWSARIFYGVAVTFLILYGLSAFSRADTTGTGIWLNVMHIAAAVGIVPPLARGIDRSI